MHALMLVLTQALGLYMWCLIIMAIMSWLLAFNVLNRSNPTVYRVYDFFQRITEPALMPIRKVIPAIGGIDISPVVLILLIRLVQQLIYDNYLYVGP